MSAARGVVTAVVGMLSRGSNQISMVVVTLVATRFLTPAQFGVFSLAAAGVTLIRTMLYVGAFEYLLKAPDPERVTRAVLALNLMLATGLSLILLAGGLLGHSVFSAPELPLLLLIAAPSNLIAAFTAWQEAQILRGKGLRAYYAVTASAELIAASCAVALLFLGFGVYALIAQLYCRAALLLLGYLALQRPPLGAPLSLATLRELAGWSSHRYAGVFTGFFSNYGADFIIGALLSPAATGLYRAGSRIVTAVADVFNQPITMIATTAYSRRAAMGRDSSTLWPQLFLAIGVVGWPALAGLAVMGEELVPFALGKAWAGTGSVVAILCVARGVGFIASVVGSYLVVKNFQRAVLGVQLFSAFGAAAALAVFARFGLTAAAGAVASVSVLSSLALLGLTLRIDPGARPALLRSAGIAFLAAAATAGAAMAGLHLPITHTLARLGLAVLLGVVAWAVVVFLARRDVRLGVDALGAN